MDDHEDTVSHSTLPSIFRHRLHSSSSYVPLADYITLALKYIFFLDGFATGLDTSVCASEYTIELCMCLWAMTFH